jgi:hypothetical protein
VSCYVDWEDVMLLKYDSSGNLIWSKEISDGIGDGNNPPVCLIDDAENSYITCAFYNNGNKKVGFVKIDSSGSTIWTKYYDYNYIGYLNAGTSISMDSDIHWRIFKCTSDYNMQHFNC